MQLLCPNEPLRCLRLTIADGPSEMGPRLGGRSPLGVYPSEGKNPMRYFATIPLSTDPALETSIFVHIDPKVMVSHKLHKDDNTIQVVVHGPSQRGSSSALDSKLSEHPLKLLEESDDWIIDPDDGSVIVESRHKIGGRPYVIQQGGALETAVNGIQQEGFIQVVQLDFPVVEGDAMVSGPWPFFDGEFHLFGKVPFQGQEWYWFFEH
jgi:hypothetical protein